MLNMLLSEAAKVRSLVEIAVLSVLFFIVLNFIRGTRGAAVLKGMIFMFVIGYVGILSLAEAFELGHLKQLLAWLLSISFLALIVIFAPELRRGLSRLAQSNVFVHPVRRMESDVLREVVDAAFELGRRRIGALVTLERESSLGDIIDDSGVRQEAAVNSRLLQSIFVPGSPLHDGSVIIRSGRVAAAGCQLPLPDNPNISKDLGMRHRAAIGITEESDAVALVVSEETGQVSLCVGGRIHLGVPDRKALYDELEKLLGPSSRTPWWLALVRRRSRGGEDGEHRNDREDKA